MTESSTIGRSYAEALFALGQKTGEDEAYARAFETLIALLESDPRVRDFLGSPKIDVAAKKDVLVRAFENRVPRLFLNFLLVVLDKRRQRFVPEISREYGRLVDERLGRLHVQVTLAHEPDERMEREIAAELGRIFGKRVIAHVHVDPKILGGIVVRSGDRVLDGSLRRRLLSLRHRLLETALPATVTA